MLAVLTNESRSCAALRPPVMATLAPERLVLSASVAVSAGEIAVAASFSV